MVCQQSSDCSSRGRGSSTKTSVLESAPQVPRRRSELEVEVVDLATLPRDRAMVKDLPS